MPKTRAEIRAQYPDNEMPDKAIATKLEAAANTRRRISCRVAHKIAQELNCPSLKVGQTADLIGIRINRCQLGLFDRKDTDVQPLSKDDITQEMQALVESVVSNGQLACIDSWRMADQLNLSRLQMGVICNELEIKVSPCQLGAF